MRLRKQLLKWGNGLAFRFTKKEVELYNLEEDQVYEFEILKIIRKKTKK